MGSIQLKESLVNVICHTVTMMTNEQLEKFGKSEECNKDSGASPLDIIALMKQHFKTTTKINLLSL